MTPIRVVIADDHRLMRTGLRRLLEMEPDMEVVGEAADGREAIEVSLREHPDVVLMDISMPGLGGIEAARTITGQLEGTRILFLTIHGEEQYVLEAIQAGAAGYVLKDISSATLVEAVRRVARGGAYVDPEVVPSLLRSLRRQAVPGWEGDSRVLDLLSAREREVLSLVVAGYSNREIARRLYISEKTVKNHLSSIFAKMGVRDRTQAAVRALRAGLKLPG